eukprot:gnl/TRDRNA2_/TRDRNA2_160368_c0_seq1.p1 gnl/TRDRNA2_/TRDRNA2_160368_c0~~gnl/TRDRNA2_/TRDRNA2_160368_c0_seq1.p1  ORF type:complete len:266 (-),score=57.03 gnl/TRDRNA2_/TRDRNA2_160368_c0_seq1:203-1000(-)
MAPITEHSDQPADELPAPLEAFLRGACPAWSSKGIANVIAKLDRIQICALPDLMIVLKEEHSSVLNQKLSRAGEKVFKSETLRALCNHMEYWERRQKSLALDRRWEEMRRRAREKSAVGISEKAFSESPVLALGIAKQPQDPAGQMADCKKASVSTPTPVSDGEDSDETKGIRQHLVQLLQRQRFKRLRACRGSAVAPMAEATALEPISSVLAGPDDRVPMTDVDLGLRMPLRSILKKSIAVGKKKNKVVFADIDADSDDSDDEW